MRVASVASLLITCSCFGFNIIPSTDDSSQQQGTDAAATPAADSTTDSAVLGGLCGVDPDTGVTLCLAISTCPDVVIDPDLFPGCGFRIHPTSVDVIDMECACYGQICPIGVATTCAQAATLMQDQSQYTVCMQVDEGRCTAN